MVFAYLDDAHKACNKKFADLLGYKSPQEWADTDAPLADVIEEDQQKMIDAYGNASQKMMATSLNAAFTNVNTGKTVKTSVVMVPMAYDSEIFAVHFITKI